MNVSKGTYKLAMMGLAGVLTYDFCKAGQRQSLENQLLRAELKRSQLLNQSYASQLHHDTFQVTPGNIRFSGKK
jgi:hypothetical protein